MASSTEHAEDIAGLVVMDAADIDAGARGSRSTEDKPVCIGVLALQGAFKEHCALLRACGAHACEVRTEKELQVCDGLVLPGGESTAMMLIAQRTGMVSAALRVIEILIPIILRNPLRS